MSRGLSANDLINNERWVSGPSFWPKQPDLGELPPDAEVKKDSRVYAAEISEDYLDRFFYRYSSWYRLKRAVVQILCAKAPNVPEILNVVT